MSKTEMEYVQDIHAEHLQGVNVLYTGECILNLKH